MIGCVSRLTGRLRVHVPSSPIRANQTSWASKRKLLYYARLHFHWLIRRFSALGAQTMHNTFRRPQTAHLSGFCTGGKSNFRHEKTGSLRAKLGTDRNIIEIIGPHENDFSQKVLE